MLKSRFKTRVVGAGSYKRLGTFIFSALLLLGLAACGAVTGAANSTAGTVKEQELVVFAAASLNKALSELANTFNTQNPDVKLIFTFDSSGTLKTQIQEGADCDVFISAGQKQMDQLDLNANVEVNSEGLDFVDSGSRFNLLENQIVLVVPAGNPAGIRSFNDLNVEKVNLMTICNEDVPVGQYAAEMLNYLDIYTELNEAGKISFASNTTEAALQVAEGSVDCGIVYRTDVASSPDPSKLEIIAAAPVGSVTPAVYPAAVMKNSKNKETAAVYLDFLRSPEAQAILEKYGFVTKLD